MLYEIDRKYLASLKERIVTYPTAHVAPLLANVQLSPGQAFDSENLEGYNYKMIGGNHSREAYQLLLEDPVHRLHESFHFRPTAVYANLSDNEALALGRQHNLSSEVQLPSKFQDDVRLTRRLFTEIESPKKNAMLSFKEEMKAVFVKVFCVDVCVNVHVVL